MVADIPRDMAMCLAGEAEGFPGLGCRISGKSCCRQKEARRSEHKILSFLHFSSQLSVAFGNATNI